MHVSINVSTTPPTPPTHTPTHLSVYLFILHACSFKVVILNPQYASYSPKYLSKGYGSLKFRLINMRQRVIFGFFRGGILSLKSDSM